MNNSYLSKGRRIFKISPKNEEQYKEKKKIPLPFLGPHSFYKLFFLSFLFCVCFVFERAWAPRHFLLGKGHPMRKL